MTENHLRLARLPVVAVGPVGRDLHLFAGDLGADRAEGAPDVPVGVGDRLHDLQDLVRGGIRREIEVVDRPVEEGVADGPADESEFVPRLQERGGQTGHGRGGSQVAQPREDCRNALHDSHVRCWRCVGCPVRPDPASKP